MRVDARVRPWRPTPAHVRAVACGLGALAAALAASRADLVVIATPLVIVAAWGAITRPTSEPAPSSRLALASLREGEATYLHCELSRAAGAEIISTVVAESPWLQFQPPRRAAVVYVGSDRTEAAQDDTVTVSFGMRSLRWGTRHVGPAMLAATSPWGAFRWGTATLPQRAVLTFPAAPGFDARAPAPHPQGLVGVNRSARRGEGAEFESLRLFQAGDRLRRIHWPSSLRAGELHVSSTYADSESQVLLIVDATADLGRSEGIDGDASTLDNTVRATAAIAEHFIRRGERVGLRVVGAGVPTLLLPRTGAGQLRRILTDLARTHPGGSADDRRLNLRQRIEPGTLVILLSPLVSREALTRAVTLGRRGFDLVVVDTMPESLRHRTSLEDTYVDLAWRIRLLERKLEILQVAEAGVPVVPWRGSASLDSVLRDMARRAAAPRLAHR